MLKKIVAISSIVACQFVSAGESYFGGNYAFIDLDLDVAGEEASLAAIYGRLGTFFNEYLSGEIRVGFGIGDDTIQGVDVELNEYFGGYLRAGIPANDVIYPYVIVGFTRAEVEISAGGLSESDSDSDFSYGIGTDIKISENANINIEYMNYYDDGGDEITAIAIGATKSF